MSRRMKFSNQADLTQAYARLSDQDWVDSCTVDVPKLEMHVHLIGGIVMKQRADAWIRRQPWWQPAVPRRRPPETTDRAVR